MSFMDDSLLVFHLFSCDHGYAARTTDRLCRRDGRAGHHARHVGLFRLRHHRHPQSLHVLSLLISLCGEFLTSLISILELQMFVESECWLNCTKLGRILNTTLNSSILDQKMSNSIIFEVEFNRM